MASEAERLCRRMKAYIDGPSSGFLVTDVHMSGSGVWEPVDSLRMFNGFLQPDMLPLNRVDVPRLSGILIPTFDTDTGEWALLFLPLDARLYAHDVLVPHLYNFSDKPDPALARTVMTAVLEAGWLHSVDVQPVMHDCARHAADTARANGSSRGRASMVMTFCVMQKLAAAMRTMGMHLQHLNHDDVRIFVSTISAHFKEHEQRTLRIMSQPRPREALPTHPALTPPSSPSYREIMRMSQEGLADFLARVRGGGVAAFVSVVRHLLYRWAFGTPFTTLYYAPRLDKERHLTETGRGNRAIMCGNTRDGYACLVCFQRCWFLYRVGGGAAAAAALKCMTIDVDDSTFALDTPRACAAPVSVSWLAAMRACWWYALTCFPPSAARMRAWAAEFSARTDEYMREAGEYAAAGLEAEHREAQALELRVLIHCSMQQVYERHGVRTLAEICAQRRDAAHVAAYVAVSRRHAAAFDAWMGRTGGVMHTSANAQDPMQLFLSDTYGSAYSHFPYLVHPLPANVIDEETGISMPYAPDVTTAQCKDAMELRLSFLRMLNYKLRYYVVLHGDAGRARTVAGPEGVVALAQRDVCETMREVPEQGGGLVRRLVLDYVAVDPGRGGWTQMAQFQCGYEAWRATDAPSNWMAMPLVAPKLQQDARLALYTRHNPLQWCDQLTDVLRRIRDLHEVRTRLSRDYTELWEFVNATADVPIMDLFPEHSREEYGLIYDASGTVVHRLDLLLTTIARCTIETMYRFAVHPFALALYDHESGHRVLKFPRSFMPLLFLQTAARMTSSYPDDECVRRLNHAPIPVNVIRNVFLLGDVGAVIENTAYDAARGCMALELRGCDRAFKDLLYTYLYNITDVCMSSNGSYPAKLDAARSDISETIRNMMASLMCEDPSCAVRMWKFVMTLGI